MTVSKITRVANAKKKFGAADSYYHLQVDRDGIVVDLLLTEDELNRSARRAALNPEDCPQPEAVKKGWVARLLG